MISRARSARACKPYGWITAPLPGSCLLYTSGLVKRLFETEVPEIYDGTVEIKAVSREAGSRTKLAVYSRDPNVDAVGACIGPRGARVGKVVDLLGGEKIDIVKYSENPAEFIAAALALSLIHISFPFPSAA